MGAYMLKDIPSEYKLERVGKLKPVRNEDGSLFVDCYDDLPVAQYNRFGRGEFCRYEIDHCTSASGVYMFVADGEIIYIGGANKINVCVSSYKKITPGVILPKGQGTYCRINKALLETFREGKEIEAWYIRWDDYRALKAHLLQINCPKYQEP